MPGVCRAFVSPFWPSDPRASVIVTLFSALRGPCVRFRSGGSALTGSAPADLRADGGTGPGAACFGHALGAARLPGWYSMCPNPHAS
ncbi:hypothetical protein GCM10022384_57640 [Streptomyces marokkonensis]|uniref:Uncharacterized protein n=1 Tax=Streptomyces marokkonensis TaxID=324855 RepID=A0ABP7RX39_9ACTN